MVARLCAPIEGTDAARLADCLGLDPAKYHAPAAGGVRDALEDALLASTTTLDSDARYKVRPSWDEAQTFPSTSCCASHA